MKPLTFTVQYFAEGSEEEQRCVTTSYRE